MRIEAVPYSHLDAATLIAEVQAEYVTRYGSPDESSIEPDEFTPPAGLFLVGYVGATPVATGAWRAHEAPGQPVEDAEIKRMFVRAGYRGRGFAREVLAELERTAAKAGFRRMILETGPAQPEAIALYRSAGYLDMDYRFGFYASYPNALYLAKPLP